MSSIQSMMVSNLMVLYLIQVIIANSGWCAYSAESGGLRHLWCSTLYRPGVQYGEHGDYTLLPCQGLLGERCLCRNTGELAGAAVMRELVHCSGSTCYR